MKPIRLAISKPAQKGYINTVLFLATSIVLFGFAALAYTLFYWNFIPKIGIEKTVYFQFSEALQPWGVAHLGDALVHDQEYDITIHLDLPRSPANLDAGNFMLEMVLLSPAIRKDVFEKAIADVYPRKPVPGEEHVIFRSRRPAILTYHSHLIDVARRLAGLPWYMTGWQREAEALSVPMAESLSFSRGRNKIPASIMLEMKHGEGKTNIQVYTATVKLQARFCGLRWLMYNHRIFSSFIFTTAFWLAEMVFAVISWVLLAIWATANAPSTEGTEKKIKLEDDVDASIDDFDLSDTPRTFPTLSRQAPLRYEPKVKTEMADEDNASEKANTRPFGAEADDELGESVDVVSGSSNFQAGNWVDSGIGTSLSEGGGSGLQRRRSKGRGVNR